MKLKKIKIKNFRILKDFDLDIEDDLSLILGKNNCGKTSLLAILEKFIGSQRSSNSFSYHDFNCDFRKMLFESIKNQLDWDSLEENGIMLYLYIQYEEEDNIKDLQPFILDLDPNNTYVILKFEYTLDKEKYKMLSTDFFEFYTSHNKEEIIDVFRRFIGARHKSYFSIEKKAVEYDWKEKKIKDNEFVIIKNDSDISKVISFRCVNAKRDAINNESNHSLSNLSSLYYEKLKEPVPSLDDFEKTILKTDQSFTETYDKIFKEVVNKVKRFGGIRENDTRLKIISTLSQSQLLKGNTTVIYEENEIQLPESYNGLGYLNLISMIMEIEIYLQDFLKTNYENESPALINLLFIEEPEAHTHPQLQYIFIKNIMNMLHESVGGRINLQTIITTHSSHIVAECNFDDIKYFKKIDNNVHSKNIKDLEIAYKDEKNPSNNHYKFLKQYLTLNCSEIFFADKAILFEGDTERILLPAMMKKIDQENECDNNCEIPLLSQNISLIPIGAYFHIFEKFLLFIGIKTLIITDLDSVKEVRGKDGKKTRKACRVEEGKFTSNKTLKKYLSIPESNSEIEYLRKLSLNSKIISYDKKNKKWIASENGTLCIAYQTEENGYNARSFEDSFIHINNKFFMDNSKNFESIKNKSEFDSDTSDAYEIAQTCIQGKATFALDILLNSEEKNGDLFSNWNIPKYIKDGLLWIRKD